ncbi:MAG: hypothetical protein K2X29_10555 [Candidatus Obscuribacterales bacterium]|nr:hypothetical protein [Candidatus Obscuribacterales bacterium]
MRNLAIGFGMFAIVIALAFALPNLMPGIDRNTYYPSTADSTIFDELQPVTVEQMPETVSVVRRPAIVETNIIRRPVARIAARRPNVTLREKKIEYDDNGRIEEVEYDYDDHHASNSLHRLGHKIFH